MEPLNLNLNDITVDTFDPVDPSAEPSQIMIVSTDNLVDCGTHMSAEPGF